MFNVHYSTVQCLSSSSFVHALQVRDGTVRRIAKLCPQLERLALANCASLTDTAVAELATYVRAIGALDVSNCRLLGNRGVGALAAHCTGMHTLDVSSTAVDSDGYCKMQVAFSAPIMILIHNCSIIIIDNSHLILNIYIK